MNARKFSDAMGQLCDRYIEEALSYGKAHRSRARARTVGVTAAAVLAVFALCGFTAYALGLFDPWLQTPSADPVQTVQSALEAQAGKDYTVCLRIDTVEVSQEETERMIQMYSGSSLAEERGWTETYLAEHFVAVWAKYYVEYDHTKTFMDDGCTEQYFYLTQDAKTGKWEIVDNTSPSTAAP